MTDNASVDKPTRIPMVDPAKTTGRTRALLDASAAKRGRVSSMVRVLARSPAAVAGYFSLHASLNGGVLSAGLRERIAIAVAQANCCDTCLAAHTEFGRMEGVTPDELEGARDGSSSDPAMATALGFALSVMRTIGHVSDAELAVVRAAGFNDAAILEITACVFMNVFTNAVNHLAETTPDYPPVLPRRENNRR